ncbi:GyrI-like domain-containing protein [Burkholderia pyrrocinia]|uniref:GyrI-like domain-containing protein n=1 Tax=Burkholderia pyrrocinia TaxID=60550 RepID=UPI001FB2B012|nr:GyrI-like domain-containing protein [Burkholderia pyrrocinia]UOB56965.1 GyrI-like domain-containing protein [Burkholderia pyrrocinia]
MNYELVDLGPLTITGIALRTDNSEAGLAKIQQHWAQFFQQGILQQIGAGESTPICEAYFDYESDASGSYTLLLGSRLSGAMPSHVDGVQTHSFPAARYAKFHVEDSNGIRAAWQHIWSRQDLDRLYACDFEIIGAEGADIYVSVKS